ASSMATRSCDTVLRQERGDALVPHLRRDDDRSDVVRVVAIPADIVANSWYVSKPFEHVVRNIGGELIVLRVYSDDDACWRLDESSQIGRIVLESGRKMLPLEGENVPLGALPVRRFESKDI